MWSWAICELVLRMIDHVILRNHAFSDHGLVTDMILVDKYQSQKKGILLITEIKAYD